MSMPAPVLPPPLRDGDRLSREEFMLRWDAMPDLKFAELIDGIVYMASPVSRPHRLSQSNLNYWLSSYQLGTPGCEVGANGTWLMADSNIPQPDLALRILPEYGGQTREEGNYSAGAPELVAEVSHTTAARDGGAKLRLYERSGVREYIIARTAKQRIVWRELVDGGYEEVAPDADGVFRSRVFPGLWLDSAALFDCDLAGLNATLQRGLVTPEHAAFARDLAARKR